MKRLGVFEPQRYCFHRPQQLLVQYQLAKVIKIAPDASPDHSRAKPKNFTSRCRCASSQDEVLKAVVLRQGPGLTIGQPRRAHSLMPPLT